MTLRILSYNILAGGEDRLSFIKSVIQKQQPDVAALQEARSHSNSEVLAQQLEMELTLGEANNGMDHVVWLTRLPAIHTENHQLPVFAKTLLEIKLLWEGAPLVLFSTHLKAGRSEEHEQRRVAEMQTIIEIMQQLTDQPHLLVGDLNALHPTDKPNVSLYLATEPWEGEENMSEDLSPRQVIPLLLEAGYVDCYRVLHSTTPGYTYKLPTPALRLDYIFASPPLARRLYACGVVTGGEAEMASDHFPIWAEFR
jgi:exodeoxyribonuclease-3